MATEAQIIEHLRKLSERKDRPQCDDDEIPYYASFGNVDETYQMGTTDGKIMLAKALIDALDNDADMPDLPDEDEDGE